MLAGSFGLSLSEGDGDRGRNLSVSETRVEKEEGGKEEGGGHDCVYVKGRRRRRWRRCTTTRQHSYDEMKLQYCTKGRPRTGGRLPKAAPVHRTMSTAAWLFEDTGNNEIILLAPQITDWIGILMLPIDKSMHKIVSKVMHSNLEGSENETETRVLV